jgi:hypothetical protein
VEVIGPAGTVVTHAGGVSDPDLLAAALRRHPAVAEATVRLEGRGDDQGAAALVAEITSTDMDLTPDRLIRALADQAPTQAPPTDWRLSAAAPPPVDAAQSPADPPTDEVPSGSERRESTHTVAEPPAADGGPATDAPVAAADAELTTGAPADGPAEASGETSGQEGVQP